MRLTRITLRDIGPYRDPVSIDLSAARGVVAVTGANGCGKSTLLRACAAVFDRAERLVLAKRAGSKQAYIEAEFASGPLSRVRLSFAGSRTEALAFGRDGLPILSSTSVDAWDAWSRLHLIPSDVYGVTLYAAQGSGGWTDLPTAQRRSIVLRALGIERLERMAGAAREIAVQETAAAKRAADQADALRPQADVGGAETRHAAAVRVADAAQADVTAADAALEAARREHVDAVARYENATEARAKAEAAKAREKAAREAVRSVSDRQEECRRVLRGAADVDAAEARLPELRRAEAAAAGAVIEADAAVRAAVQRRADAETAAKRADETLRTATAAAERARRAAHDLPAARLADAEAEAAAVKVAAEEAEYLRLDSESLAARDRLAQAESAKRSAHDAFAAAHREAQAAAHELRAAVDDVAIAEGRCRDLPQAEGAEARAAQLREAIARDEAEAKRLAEQIETLRAATLDVAGRRIRGLREALSDIDGSCSDDTASDLRTMAAEALAADDTMARESVGAPDRLRSARTSADIVDDRLCSARADLATAERLAARLPDLRAQAEVAKAAAEKRDARRVTVGETQAAVVRTREAEGVAADAERVARGALGDATRAAATYLETVLRPHRADRDAARALAARLPDLERADAEAREASAAVTRASEALSAARQSVSDASVAVTRATGRALDAKVVAANAKTALRDVEALAARASEISAARARSEELERARQAADAEMEAAREAVRAAPEPPESVPMPPDLTELERAAEERWQALRAARDAVAVTAAAVEAARLVSEDIERLEEQAQEHRSAAADAALLAEILGQRGLIALEVDAAGPELSALANDLLRHGFGSRWTVSIQTVKPRADGAGEVEICDVSVSDSHTGIEGSIDALSGGEAVVVSEAIRMALTTIATRRLRLTEPTMLRDEPGAALSTTLPIPGCDADAPATEQHLRMLRRAGELAGGTVLLVSHDPNVPAACDARVRVDGGRITVEG